jgi:Ca2+-binding RTX toxin-like protein
MHSLLLSLAALVLATPLALQATASAAVARTCDGRPATIVGSSGAEVITGTSHADVIVALQGDDTIDGRGGDDRICGGYGADKINGGRGDDRIFGGMDRISPTDEGDTERLGDTLRGGWGRDKLVPGRDTRPADDVIRDAILWDTSRRAVHIDIADGVAVGTGPDTFDGRGITVVGSHYADVIEGGSGDDRILGSWGADVIRGHDGDDQIVGDEGAGGEVGADRLFGNNGNDDLTTEGGEDVSHGGAGKDTIDDFGRSADQLFGDAGDDLVINQLVDNGIEPVLDGGTGVDQLALFTAWVNPGAEASTGTWDMAAGDLVYDLDGPLAVTATGFEVGNLSTYGTSWTVEGTGGANSLSAGGTTGTVFHALGGNDRFLGSASDDTFDGGPGTDTAQMMGDGEDTCVDVEVFEQVEEEPSCQSPTP